MWTIHALELCQLWIENHYQLQSVCLFTQLLCLVQDVMKTLCLFCSNRFLVQEVSKIRKKKLKALDIEEDEHQEEAQKALRAEQRAQLQELAGTNEIITDCAPCLL